MKRYLIFGVYVVSSLLILSITVIAAYYWYPAKINYQIKKTFRISTGGGAASIYLGILIPQSGPYQTVKDLDIVWNGDRETDSLAYVDAVKLWDQITANQELETIVEYDVLLTQGLIAWKAPVEDHHLLSQIGIESDHPEIQQAADQISPDSGHKNPSKIFKFTSDHLEYSESGCEKTNVSALEAFKTGAGACIGYSRLMVALCRASGIPAKMIIGSILPDPLLPFQEIISSATPGGGHAWVEYYYQDYWYMADPSRVQKYTLLSLFNHLDGRHLSFGEFDQFTAAKRDLENWATQKNFVLDDELTYIFTASSDQVKIAPETNIIKTWDERWLNTLLALAIVTYLLCRIRDRLMMI
jgi:hypothetical protein